MSGPVLSPGGGRYRRRAIMVDAVRYDGTPETARQVVGWVTFRLRVPVVQARVDGSILTITTPDGPLPMAPGFWLVRAEDGAGFGVWSARSFDIAHEVAELTPPPPAPRRSAWARFVTGALAGGVSGVALALAAPDVKGMAAATAFGVAAGFAVDTVWALVVRWRKTT